MVLICFDFGPASLSFNFCTPGFGPAAPPEGPIGEVPSSCLIDGHIYIGVQLQISRIFHKYAMDDRHRKALQIDPPGAEIRASIL